nr:hypothetical protein [Tanacetum cinerariifolium]
MERGFLSSSKQDKTKEDDGNVKSSSVGLTKQVKNIKGKMLGKDGKPLKSILKRPKGAAANTPSDVQHHDVTLKMSVPKVVTPLATKDGENMHFFDLVVNMVRDEDINSPSVETTSTKAMENTRSDLHANATSSSYTNVSTSFVDVLNAARKSGKGNTCSLGSELRVNKTNVVNSDCVLTKRVAAVVKYEVNKVLVWVKLYNVPVLAYLGDGLCLIATQIGKLIMLDAFTGSMCVDSWGRISFARALIEVCANSVLKKEVIMAIENEEGDEYTREVYQVDYEADLGDSNPYKDVGKTHVDRDAQNLKSVNEEAVMENEQDILWSKFKAAKKASRSNPRTSVSDSDEES